MSTLINSKLENNIMNKIFMFLFLTMLMFSSAFSGDLISSQSDAKSLRDISQGYNGLEITYFGSDNINITSGDTNITYDIVVDTVLTDKLYFEYEVTNITAQNLTIYSEWDNANIITTNSITFTDTGIFVFVFEPTSSKEHLKFYIDYPDSEFGFETFKFTREQGLSDTIVLMVNKVLELIDLNLLIWELSIYIISFSVAIFIMFSIINFIINIHRKMREVRDEISKTRKGRD